MLSVSTAGRTWQLYLCESWSPSQFAVYIALRREEFTLMPAWTYYD